jgi:ribonucleoside-diphosphate reductase alpha chain
MEPVARKKIKRGFIKMSAAQKKSQVCAAIRSEFPKVDASYSENALKMMRKRYLQTDTSGNQESPGEMLHRIAHALAAVEKKYGHDDAFVQKMEWEFFKIMARKEYTPAGRTVTNAGAATPIVANCIVLPVLDSMESIFQTLKDAALLQQAGSGLGFDFSHLRPAMSPTKRSRGVSSGPVSFLKVYNEAFGVIKQQGRHGANMAMMQVDHPDILDFIRAKEVEGELRNFNISVKVTDEFMRQVLERPDEQWYCEWNGVKMKPRRVLHAKNGAVIGVEEVNISAKEIFDELVHYAWLNGEPGIVFIDEVNRTNPLPGLGPIDCSNPCVTGATLVATEKGFLKMEELAEKYPNGNIKIAVDRRLPRTLKTLLGKRILCGKEGVSEEPLLILEFPAANTEGEMVKAFATGTKPVYKLITRSGYELEATAEHKIFTPRGKIELSQLRPGDKILIQSQEGLWSNDDRLPFDFPKMLKGKNGHYQYNFPARWSRELGQVVGWLIGNGWLRDKRKQYAVGFAFSQEDIEVMKRLKHTLNGWDKNSKRQEILRKNGIYHLRYASQEFVQFFKSLGVKAVKTEEKEVPALLWQAPREAVIGFLRGIFSANGAIAIRKKNQTPYIRLTSKSEKLLKQIQILLLNFGIKSALCNKSPKPQFTLGYEKDGKLYELQISRANISLFINTIGFLGKHYAARDLILNEKPQSSESFEEVIKEIKYVGNKKVYDLTELTTHSFIANGIVISNCGEQFLHHYDNCNLGSVNLAVFVKNGKIDWARLRRTVKTAVRMMDNVIDLFDFPVPQVTELALKNRRIGLGIMGFADMLYELGVAYNSPEGVKLGEKVMKTITDAAHEMSRELAEEKGVFPNYPLSVYAKSKVKMRNAALTTVAPTGSISMMFDCSSGIEPNFALAYVKQDKDGHQYHYFNRYFEEALRRARLSEAKIKEIKDEVIKTGSIQGIPDLPEDLRKTFVVAMDISAEAHIEMQAAFQKYVDNSISKTINFPRSATKEDVARGFIHAWKLKCKSVTVYRDGSREVQILNIGTGEGIKSPTEIGKPGAAEEEKKKLNLTVDVGRYEARPRPEVMAGRTYKVKTGYGTLYVTVNNDENGVPFEVFATIGKSGGFFQEQSEGICRLISLALRSGVKVDEVIDNLKGIRGPMPVITEKGTILSLPDAIGKILEEHVRATNGAGPMLAEAKSEIADFETKNQPVAARKKSLADLGFAPGCPDCGAPLQIGEGCLSCKNCGFSRCM